MSRRWRSVCRGPALRALPHRGPDRGVRDGETGAQSIDAEVHSAVQRFPSGNGFSRSLGGAGEQQISERC